MDYYNSLSFSISLLYRVYKYYHEELLEHGVHIADTGEIADADEALNRSRFLIVLILLDLRNDFQKFCQSVLQQHLKIIRRVLAECEQQLEGFTS